ncbi:MAG: sensor histidine kinase [bacterium]
MRKKYNNIIEPTDGLNALAVGIAHEIKNPLFSIQANSTNVEIIVREMKYLLEDCLEDETDPKIAGFSPPEAFIRLFRCLQGIKSSAARINGVIDNFNEFAGHGRMETTRLDLQKIIEETKSIMQPLVEEVGTLEVIWNFEPPVWIEGNFLQLDQALNNLIGNAVDALAEKKEQEVNFHGRIKLIIDKEKRDNREFVRIKIKDNGPGVSDKLKSKIFMPFITTKRQGKGFGVGLAKVRGVAIRHEGRLFLEDNQDPGATFVLELPVAGE